MTVDHQTRNARKAIADIHLDSRREAMRWLPELHSRTEAIAYFVEQVLQHNEVMVAELDQTAAGFLALESDCVEHLYIALKHQSRGIGDRLLSFAKELRPQGTQALDFSA